MKAQTMHLKMNGKCPHCQSILIIERLDEPRIVPCPGCNTDIRVPDQIIFANRTAAAPAARQIPPLVASPQQNQPTVPQRGMPARAPSQQSGSSILLISSLVVSAVLLLVMTGMVLSRPDSHAGIPVPPEPNQKDPEPSGDGHAAALAARKAEIERLKLDIEKLKQKIAQTDSALREIFNNKQLDLDGIQLSYKGVQQ